MPRFAYTARDRSGQSVVDELEAPSRKDALRRLQARGLQPLRLDERAAAPRKTAKPKSAKPAASASRAASAAAARTPSRDRTRKIKYPRKHLLPFLQALYDLTSSGLSAGEAIRLLATRLKDPVLRGL